MTSSSKRLSRSLGTVTRWPFCLSVSLFCGQLPKIFVQSSLNCCKGKRKLCIYFSYTDVRMGRLHELGHSNHCALVWSALWASIWLVCIVPPFLQPKATILMHMRMVMFTPIRNVFWSICEWWCLHLSGMYFEAYANGGVYTCPECILKHMRMVVFTPVRNVFWSICEWWCLHLSGLYFEAHANGGVYTCPECMFRCWSCTPGSRRSGRRSVKCDWRRWPCSSRPPCSAPCSVCPGNWLPTWWLTAHVHTPRPAPQDPHHTPRRTLHDPHPMSTYPDPHPMAHTPRRTLHDRHPMSTHLDPHPMTHTLRRTLHDPQPMSTHPDLHPMTHTPRRTLHDSHPMSTYPDPHHMTHTPRRTLHDPHPMSTHPDTHPMTHTPRPTRDPHTPTHTPWPTPHDPHLPTHTHAQITWHVPLVDRFLYSSVLCFRAD